jgi:vacuolar-type H+-ATPase subunit I/STV1
VQELIGQKTKLEARVQELVAQSDLLERQVQERIELRTQLEAQVHAAQSHSPHPGHEMHEKGDGIPNERELLERIAQLQTQEQNLKMENERLQNLQSLKEIELESDEKEKEGLTAKLLERDETLLLVRAELERCALELQQVSTERHELRIPFLISTLMS